ncbi:ATP-dependent DNA ligase [Candidatus Woesearchaeota archaeon]|nr:ATP-dependent DNA ligase [Candidatus Woesearchaeota archaeon]
MDFQKLVDVYEELENTASGNKMREILSDFFKEVPEEDIAIVSYLTLGRLASEYESVVLGMAEKIALKAVSLAGGVDSSKVKQTLGEMGDAGLVAEKLLKKKPITLVPVGKLTIHDLFSGLHKIAEASGSGSQDMKINTLAAMLQKVSSGGAKYLVRIALGTLRMGVGDMTVLDSLAIAFTGEKKNKAILERAYNFCPDVGIIAETLAKKGLKGVKKIEVKVGRPIKMMLCQRVGKIAEIADKIPGKIAVDEKYDGERLQVHKVNGEITLFSRRMEEVTLQFPDVVEYLQKQVKGKDFIVEGEVVAISEEGKALPFQVLMRRRRKHDVEEYVAKIPVCLFLFDLLYLNGKSYLDKPYLERMTALEKIVKKGEHLTLTKTIVTEDVDEVEKFFNESLQQGYEGIIAKSTAPESIYKPGTRGWLWIKWKKEYVQEMQDTFDLVVIGAFLGKGRRAGVYGALLLAAYNKKEDVFESVTKCGTGFTDAVLGELPQRLGKYKMDRQPARVKVKKEMAPEVWFEPQVVVEVLGAEITRSPIHICAVKDGKGLAIRFPRFIQFRDDKNPEQATTSKEMESIYEN